jgi:hypothetical protein
MHAPTVPFACGGVGQFPGSFYPITLLDAITCREPRSCFSLPFPIQDLKDLLRLQVKLLLEFGVVLNYLIKEASRIAIDDVEAISQFFLTGKGDLTACFKLP